MIELPLFSMANGYRFFLENNQWPQNSCFVQLLDLTSFNFCWHPDYKTSSSTSTTRLNNQLDKFRPMPRSKTTKRPLLCTPVSLLQVFFTKTLLLPLLIISQPLSAQALALSQNNLLPEEMWSLESTFGGDGEAFDIKSQGAFRERWGRFEQGEERRDGLIGKENR